MKKLIMVILVAIMSFQACGQDGWSEPMDFYNDMYTDCVDFCTVCAEWVKKCNWEFNYEYTVERCVSNNWDHGSTAETCNERKELRQRWIDREDCISFEEWVLNTRCVYDNYPFPN